VRKALLLPAALIHVAVACGASDVTPFTAVEQLAHLEEPEQRVWAESADVDKALSRSGRLMNDAAVDEYLQALVNRLFPDVARAVRVRAIRDPEMNAFCMPNGSVYMNLGMLSRLRNEGQLATILAHEGSHFTHRHGFQQRTRAITTAAIMQVTAFAGLGGAVLGNLIGLSSIQGFSRDHEREADRAGFRRLVDAGFDYRESPRVFEMLAAESQALAMKEPYFFASHPALKDRIASFQDLIGNTVTAMPGSDEARFRSIVTRVHRSWYELEIAKGRGDRLIHVLTQPGAGEFYGAESSYYLGEAYRVQGNKADEPKMLEAYRMAMSTAPRFAPAFLALGVHYYKQKDCRQASPLLSTYLELEPAGAMSAHARRFLDKCK